MRLVALTLGGFTTLFVGIFAIAEHDPTGPAGTVLEQAARPHYLQVEEPRIRLAQQYGTVCQTPQGSVCTVAPQPMNSRCQCGSAYGLIVR